jgi:Sec-independent protein translocase protein TatA
MEGFSFSELILIIIVAIIIYGKDLPQAARKMAILYSKFKRQLNDVRDEIRRQIPMDELENAVKIDLPTGPGGEPPQTPYGLVASPTTSNVLLTWNSSTGSNSYTIRRSTSPQDPWLIVAMNISELAWTDTDVQPGKTYHYSVTGVNDTGESGSSDEATATIPGGELPAPAAAAAPSSAATATEPSSAQAAEDKPASATAPEAATAPANGNGHAEHPKESPAPAAAPEVKPS